MDIFLLVLFPILALSASLFFRINFLESTILFFAVPVIYLIIIKKSLFLKSFIFALFSSFFIFIFFDTLITLDQAWIVPNTFSFKMFGLLSFEEYILEFLWILLIVLFYESFLHKEKQTKVFGRKMKYLYFIYIVLPLFIIILYFSHNLHILQIPYIYVYLSLFSVFIPIAFLYSHPNFLKKFALVAGYFFFLAFLFEIGGLYNKYWIFPSEHYLMVIKLFNHKFPVEEVVFWMIFSAPALLAVYEYFGNDRDSN